MPLFAVKSTVQIGVLLNKYFGYTLFPLSFELNGLTVNKHHQKTSEEVRVQLRSFSDCFYTTV